MTILEGGNIKVFTGPKGGKFVIRNTKKVYLDRKSITNSVQYVKKGNNGKK